ncbi:MAG: WD40/YVTN/BNR-like repeat-containing protein, partial [Bacteroidota bacterium]
MKKIILFILTLTLVIAADAQSIKESALKAVHYRSIGPTRQGGRYVDFAVVDKNPTTFYAALATGGLWFTEDNGITFDILFEDAGAISIGDIAVDQNNPDIVWVGTGEANNSRTAYYGDGIYRSDDRGETWKNMGLPESGHIGRIIIHPDDSDIVWVAALGHLYSENEERGVYKTTNGGKSWEKVLDIVDHGKHIGVVDLAIDPTDPSVLYAAAYDKVRRPWTFNAGGPGSGIYKTEDGGRSWTELAGGLPSGMLGRIGIAVSPSNPETVYANIENNNIEGVSDDERYRQLLNGIPPEGKEKGDEVYRSDDKGRTWRKVSPDGEDVGGGPAYYYQQMAINPIDPDHVYVLGVRMWETVNGGKEWRRPFNFGGDNHAMWIDPEDPEHIMLGYDHGMGISYDGGDNWYHPDFKDVGQFVAVGYDMAYPYNVYGGMQDNGSVRGPSTKKDGSPIKLEDWQSVGGGDGMYNEVDPDNNRYLYN